MPQKSPSAVEDSGFSLIELMVVVLIISVLIAAAIPTFFGVRKSAQDTHAKTNLGHTYTFALVEYSDHGSYLDANFDLLGTEEPVYEFVDGDEPSDNPDKISVHVTHGSFHAATWSLSGKCYMVRDLPNLADPNVKSRSFAVAAIPQTDCTASNASGADPDDPFDGGDVWTWSREW